MKRCSREHAWAYERWSNRDIVALRATMLLDHRFSQKLINYFHLLLLRSKNQRRLRIQPLAAAASSKQQAASSSRSSIMQNRQFAVQIDRIILHYQELYYVYVAVYNKHTLKRVFNLFIYIYYYITIIMFSFMTLRFSQPRVSYQKW